MSFLWYWASARFANQLDFPHIHINKSNTNIFIHQCEWEPYSSLLWPCLTRLQGRVISFLFRGELLGVGWIPFVYIAHKKRAKSPSSNCNKLVYMRFNNYLWSWTTDKMAIALGWRELSYMLAPNGVGVSIHLWSWKLEVPTIRPHAK